MTPAGRPARLHWLAHFLQAQGHPHQLHFAGTREMTTPVTATVEGGTALCGTTSSSLLYILPSAFVFSRLTLSVLTVSMVQPYPADD